MTTKERNAAHSNQPDSTEASIKYALDFSQCALHLVTVTLSFIAQKNQTLWLPTWIPGSYLIREFARHIESVHVVAPQNVTVSKVQKNVWQLNVEERIPVTVSYTVYAYDLSVRGCYVDTTRFYINPASLCVIPTQQEHLPINLQLIIPETYAHFSIACALQSPAVHSLKAENYSHLIDSPFELASQACAQFDVVNIPHCIAISGIHNTDLTRLVADLTKICQAQIDLFGSAPFTQYLFMVMATANSYGGLEHGSCTSLITPRDDLPCQQHPEQPTKAYRQFLGLCSHEYFHSWLVKSIRPAGIAPLALHTEADTSLLWVFEGITSYYDDLMLYRAGVIDKTSYLALLAERISQFIQNPGRDVQSLHEAGFDAWIKYYRPDENSPNATTSYYVKGALVALCLDLTLRQHGSSLDALLRLFYSQAQQSVPLCMEGVESGCKLLTGVSFATFWQQYIYGTSTLPIFSLLETVGISGTLTDLPWPLGLKCTESAQGLTVKATLRQGSAARVGVSAHDVIVAINGLKATPKLLADCGVLTQTNATLHVFRRDELMQFDVPCAGVKMQSVTLNWVDENPTVSWL